MGHCLVRRLVGGCRSAHRRRAPPRSRPRLRRRLILAPRARHALRRGLAGGQRTRRHQCAAHQPRAPATAPSAGAGADGGRRDRMARPVAAAPRARRWLADFGVDQVRPVSGNGSNTTFVNGDARYQLSRDTGLGGVVYVRRNDSTSAWSAEAYLDNANSSGIGRGQLDYATDRETRDATFTLQQTWDMRTGTRLSTTAAVERIRSTAIMNVEQDSTIVRLAVYGGGDLTARLALDGSVQWATAVQGRAAPSRSADVSLTWQVVRAWSVLASYYENRVGSWTPLVVTSPLAPPTAAAVIAAAGERGVFLTVRYQVAHGAHFVPLGGVPGSGSGRLSGVVYVDANENGRYDAGESGAANVTVILDGRFSVRSDPKGRFDFPAVAAGHHVLTVQTDNLPLPWTLTNSGRTEVDVATRDRTEINIRAFRMK